MDYGLAYVVLLKAIMLEAHNVLKPREENTAVHDLQSCVAKA